MNRITAQSPANRLPLYPQHRTFRGPRWTSGFDPKPTFGRLGTPSGSIGKLSQKRPNSCLNALWKT